MASIVLGLSAITVQGENTVMGRVLGRVLPIPMGGARICYEHPQLYLDLRTDPPTYLGSGDKAARAFDGRALDITWVMLFGRPWTGGGFWAPTRHGVATQLWFEINPFVRGSTGEFVPDADIADNLRHIALVGYRRDHPDSLWLDPPGLESAPFQAVGLRTEFAKSSHIHWPGCYHNTIAGGALAVVAWAVWPRRPASKSAVAL